METPGTTQEQTQTGETPFRFRPSVPFRYPDDFPWKGALHARAVPVIPLGGPFATQVSCARPLGEKDLYAAARRLLELYRNLNLDPLFVLYPDAPDKEHKKAGKKGAGLPRLARKLALLGARLTLLPQGGTLWQTVRNLVSDPVLFHPAVFPYARRSTLCCLLERASRKKNTSLCPSAPSGAGWPLYLAKRDVARLCAGTATLEDIVCAAPCAAILDELSIVPLLHPQDPDTERMQAALGPEEALALLRFLNCPQRGIAHAMAVGHTARALAIHYILKGKAQDEDLACAAGYVHDIAKGFGHHERVGGFFLDFLGLEKLSYCVRDHRDLVLAAEDPVGTRELVYLADKYCFGPRFVPLEQRFGMKMSLFADNPKAVAGIQKRLSHARDLEERICRELKKSPADIARDTLN